MEPSPDVALNNLSNGRDRDRDREELSASPQLGDQPSSNGPEFSLPPADGGKDAWLFLAACFVVEALVWGKRKMSASWPTLLSVSRLCIFLRSVSGILQYP